MKQPTLVRALAEDVLEDFAAAVEAKSLRLERNLRRDDFAISCDHDRIVQVLSNLIGNAIKLVSRGGSISVRQADQQSSPSRRRGGAGAAVPGVAPADPAPFGKDGAARTPWLQAKSRRHARCWKARCTAWCFWKAARAVFESNG